MPPKLFLKFFRRFCRKDIVDSIEGDLMEHYAENLKQYGHRKANRKFIVDVLLLFRPGLIRSILFSNSLINTTMFRSHFKLGIRNLFLHKSYSLINIIGLSTGMACFLFIFIFIKHETSFDNYHPASRNTYRVVQRTQYPEETLYWNTTAFPLAEALRNDFSQFDLVTQTAGPTQRFFKTSNTSGEEVVIEEDYVLFVDPYYPQVFDLKWIAGDPASALSNSNSIILTEGTVRKFFGTNFDESVIGTEILLNGKDPLTLTGIVSDSPANTTLRYNVLIPYSFFRMNNPYPAENWSGNYNGTTFVVLGDRNKKQTIEASINSWKQQYLNPEDHNRISYYLQPLEDIHTETLYGSSPGSYTIPMRVIKIATGMGIFILILAIINFVNLLTARITGRSKEVVVRKVNGGTRGQLVRQFVIEGSILITIALGLSLVVTHMLLDLTNNLVPDINLQLSLQWHHVGLIVLTGIGTMLLGTIYPAIGFSSVSPIRLLSSATSPGGFTVRRTLITFQFTIVQVFVISTLVIGSQMSFVKGMDLGFTSTSIVTVPVPQSDKMEAFRNSLQQQPAITNIAFGSGPPMAVNGFQLGTVFRLPNQQQEEGHITEIKVGDPGYLDFYNLTLIAGRNFSENHEQFNEFIVNEQLIETFGWKPEEAIGRTIAINEGEATIIGIVKDFHNNSLQLKITPCLIVNWRYFLDKAFIKTANINPEVLSGIEQSWKSTFPGMVFSYDFLDDSIAREYAVETLVFKGITAFTVIIFIISSLGLTGMMTFIVSKKTKEVGIRKVLGATVSQILLLFSKEFVILISIAFLVAAPLVYYVAAEWLETFTYRISLSVWIFAVGIFTTMIITLAVVGVQAFKAAMVNPVDSLKGE